LPATVHAKGYDYLGKNATVYLENNKVLEAVDIAPIRKARNNLKVTFNGDELKIPFADIRSIELHSCTKYSKQGSSCQSYEGRLILKNGRSTDLIIDGFTATIHLKLENQLTGGVYEELYRPFLDTKEIGWSRLIIAN
jgi:hypothetical protein